MPISARALGAVLITSANGARAVAAHPRRGELTALPVLAVGQASAAAARAAGFADVTSADGDGGDLARLAATRFAGAGTAAALSRRRGARPRSRRRAGCERSQGGDGCRLSHRQGRDVSGQRPSRVGPGPDRRRAAFLPAQRGGLSRLRPRPGADRRSCLSIIACRRGRPSRCRPPVQPGCALRPSPTRRAARFGHVAAGA